MGADLSKAKPESVEVGKYACDLIINEMWKEIRTKEDGKDDQKKVPTAGGRRIPSPLQDMTEDSSAPEPKMEQSPDAMVPQLCWPQTPQSPVAPPPMVHVAGAPPTFAENLGSFNLFNAGFAAGFANTMGGMANPNAFGHLGHLGHLGYTCPAWPPIQQLGPVLGNATTNGYANQAAFYAGGYGAYNGYDYECYDHFSSNAWQGGSNWGVPQGQGDMRQAYYPQANAPQWTGGGQTFFQPFSTQPPMQAAVQQFPPPPAYPPQHMGCGRAPLTAQFSNGPLLNTQPFLRPAAPAAYPMPMRPPAAPPAMPPAHAAPPAPMVVAPTVPPAMAPTVTPMHPSPAMPPLGPPTQIPTLPAAISKRTASPVNATKEERRLAAQAVLREQRLLFQVLARGEDVADHRSEASTAVTTPGSSEKKQLTVEVHEEEAPVAAIEQKFSKHNDSHEVKPPRPQKKPQQPQEKAQWQPKLNNKQGGNNGSKGINQVWVAKEEKGSTGNGSTGNGTKRKAHGKGKNTTEQWKVKQNSQEEASTNRQMFHQRGKKSHRSPYHWA